MKIKKMLVEMVEPDSDFMRILNIRKGKLDADTVEFDDPYIDSVDKNYVYFNFNTYEDFFEYMTTYDHMDAEDINWAYNSNQYYEFDWYTVEEDWNEGYILLSLNDDNQNKVEEIIKFISPQSLSIEESWEKSKKFSEILKVTFQNEVVKLMDAYQESKQEAMNDGIEKYIKELVDTMFKTMNIIPDYNSWSRSYSPNTFDFFKMPISSLTVMYTRYGDFNAEIKDVIKNHADSHDREFMAPPREDVYNYENMDLFNENFNFYAKRILEEMIEMIEDEEIFSPDYLKILNYIDKKYKFDEPIKVETGKSDDTYVTIKSLEPDGTINIIIKQDYINKRGANVKLSTLNTLLTNYSLFDIFD